MITDLYFLQINFSAGTIRIDNSSRARQKLRHPLQRIPCVLDGIVFHPVSKEHDKNQRGQFPEKVHHYYACIDYKIIDKSVKAVQVRSRYAERNQSHHAGTFFRQLHLRTSQKRHASIKKQSSSENQVDPI